MSINVTYPADYPAVEVCGLNPSLARLLNNDLSAAKSEMTAIHQYTYQAWRLEKDYPEISKTLSEIAMVEMRHFQPLVCHLFVLKITEIGLKSLQLHCSKTPQNRAFSHFTKDHIRCAV